VLLVVGAEELAEGESSSSRRREAVPANPCQLLTWKVARDLEAPVFDLTLFFQATDGAPLFLDQAHPNEAGQRIIADALWATISDEL
jgi:hypothetical protein